MGSKLAAKHQAAAEARNGGPSRDHAELAAALGAPFDPAEVKFKPQAVSGNRALAIPYVDARVVQDRLDEAVGVLNWQDSYECLPDGSVVCRLKIRLGDEWITKEDVGGQSEQPDEGDRRKAAFSDALKRAAVKFGIGRYLYRLKPQWVDYDPQKRQILRPPALPVPARQAPQPQPQREQLPAPADAGNRILDRVMGFQARLMDAGLCEDGGLLDWLEDQCGHAWALAPQADVEQACREYEKQCKAAKSSAEA